MIDNVPALLDHGCAGLRADAIAIAEAGWDAADACAATDRWLIVDGPTLLCKGRPFAIDDLEHIWFVGAGKASLAIAQAVEARLGAHLSGGVAVVPRGHRGALDRIRILESDHPLPTASSIEGARALFEIADAAGQRDLVLASITGGSSSLVCCPPPGVSLDDLRQLYQLLLGSGADIVEVNRVRRAVCTIKGGRLGDRIQPAAIVNLTVSDVADDILEYISDLTVQNHAHPGEASSILTRLQLWDAVPASIRSHVTDPDHFGLPDLSAAAISSILVLTGSTVLDAMARAAAALGYTPHLLGNSLRGESRRTGEALANLALTRWRQRGPTSQPLALMGCGGETTVVLGAESRWQSGGPNQELALAFADSLPSEARCVALAVDTDGHDGGTPLAGALVDATTKVRARRRRVNLSAVLDQHSASTVLQALHDGVETGTTGTNVNDMVVVLVAGVAEAVEMATTLPAAPGLRAS